MSRRTSVDNWANKLFSHITTTKDDLMGLWSEMALTDDQQKERLTVSESTVLELLDNMVLSEKQQLQTIRKKVDVYYQECLELREELGIDPFIEAELPSGLVPRGNYLKTQLQTLKADKDERMQQQVVSYNIAKEACEKIGAAFANDIYLSKIMPASAVAELKITAMESERVFKERLEKIKHIQKEARQIMGHIGRTGFVEKELAMLNVDYDHGIAVLDDSIVANFEELNSRAKYEYEEWYDKVKHEYRDLMVELDSLWRKCHVPEGQRYFPMHFDPNTQTQNDIEQLKTEIARLTIQYQQGKEIYDKLNEWLNFWEELLDYENPNAGADKYKNRGGALQAYLKREKHVKAMVPKVLSELEQLVADYSRENENVPTAGPNNMTPSEYARFIMHNHEDEKMLAKQSKEAEKMGRLRHESRFGVSPSPQKSNLNRVKVTPASIQKSKKRNVLHNLSISTIEPTLSPTHGPKTSSPKEGFKTPLKIHFRDSPLTFKKDPRTPSRVAVINPISKLQTPTTPSKHWRY